MQVKFQQSALMQESIAIIRDETTPSSKFRNHLRKIGRYLVYEAGKNFPMKSTKIQTPLAEAEGRSIDHDVVIISVLRAALPMVDAIFDEFDNAALGVVSASRGEMLNDEGTEFTIKSDYIKIPALEDKIVVIADPMLATASTIIYLLGEVSKLKPKKIVLLCAIAAEFGIKKIEKEFPNVEIYPAVVDKILNEKGYIVPGLGDAGDRACNTPHQ